MIDEIPADPDADRQQYGHIIILAKNITGLRNLYRMVTLSHLKFYRKTSAHPQAHSGRASRRLDLRLRLRHGRILPCGPCGGKR